MASSSNDQEVPEFFSVFLHDRCRRHLHISSDFSSNHIEWSNAARRRAIIRRPRINQEWKVVLVEEGNEYYFKQGWKNFVEDNSLKDGELMVFQYHGNSYFTVKIFGINACLKEGQPIANVPLVHLEDDDEEGEGGKRRPGRPAAEDPSSEAVMAAKNYMRINRDYPLFRVSIGGGYVKRNLLNVPLSFVDTHMKKGKDKRAITLKVMNRTWKVSMLVYRDSTSPNCKLSRGVSAFIRDNNIQEGDVCVFKLVNPDTFNVTIFQN